MDSIEVQSCKPLLVKLYLFMFMLYDSLNNKTKKGINITITTSMLHTADEPIHPD